MSDKHYPIGRDAMPIVQMTLRGMGEVVNHAVMLHAQDIAAVAQDAVKEAIQGFDWQERIKGDVQKAIEREITHGINQFLWSDDGKRLIEDTIAGAIKGAFGSKK